jgi:hypothetical protein
MLRLNNCGGRRDKVALATGKILDLALGVDVHLAWLKSNSMKIEMLNSPGGVLTRPEFRFGARGESTLENNSSD